MPIALIHGTDLSQGQRLRDETLKRTCGLAMQLKPSNSRHGSCTDCGVQHVGMMVEWLRRPEERCAVRKLLEVWWTHEHRWCAFSMMVSTRYRGIAVTWTDWPEDVVTLHLHLICTAKMTDGKSDQSRLPYPNLLTSCSILVPPTSKLLLLERPPGPLTRE